MQYCNARDSGYILAIVYWSLQVWLYVWWIVKNFSVKNFGEHNYAKKTAEKNERGDKEFIHRNKVLSEFDQTIMLKISSRKWLWVMLIDLVTHGLIDDWPETQST